MTFEEAKRLYVYRYTMEHVPDWTKSPVLLNTDGDQSGIRYYAPQYRTDKEWYDNTLFPPDNPCHSKDCHSSNRTWPLGKWLDKPFV